MEFYKIIQNDTIIGLATSDNFCRIQTKHRLLVFCSIDEAQYVMLNDVLYRDDWLSAITYDIESYEEAKIIAVSESEYMEYKAELDAGNMPANNELVAEESELVINDTSSEPAPKTRIQQLEEQVDMLTECLLELSEIVYG